MSLKDLPLRPLMEEDASSSMVSTAKMNIFTMETSDSFDSNCTFRSRKRSRHDHAGGNNIVSVKFKGVVPQQNGHWGAQIYANHQRIWLGTFKSEKEAAMAYDSAAIKLRSGDSHRNFPWTDRTLQEPNFQTQFSIEAILSMIRDGSYQSKFADFLRTQSHQRGETRVGSSLIETRVNENGHFSFIQLFQKELTPSDVGKLNRLVIPKKFAVKYFPYISESAEEHEQGTGGGIEDVELVFFDRLMKSWKFRYCYWRSSQSFVFTRGWNRFVKEKNLKEKDIVTFYTCLCASSQDQRQHFYLIDITYGGDGESKSTVDGVQQIEEMQKELELKLGQSFKSKMEEEKRLESINNGKGEGLRLFGVRID